MRFVTALVAALGVMMLVPEADARTYRRSCTGGVWVTYYSDPYHMHTVGWLDGRTAKATARYRRYRPNPLRGRARDRLKNDCFQDFSCSGETEVGGKMVNMTRPWPYASDYDALTAQIQADACQHARLNFRDVRSIRAQLKITGDKNCGLSDSKVWRTDLMWIGNSTDPDVICSGRHPR